MNTTTKRYPRSLTEAFGPHTSRVIHSQTDDLQPLDRVEWAIIVVCTIGTLAVPLLSYFGAI